jgi:hypothetical protein
MPCSYQYLLIAQINKNQQCISYQRQTLFFMRDVALATTTTLSLDQLTIPLQRRPTPRTMAPICPRERPLV